LRQAQDDIDALRADVLDAKALANNAQATADGSYGVGADRKFQISGYVQARYQAVSAGQGTLDRLPQGVAGGAGSYNGNCLSGNSPSSFEVRRARIKFSGQVSGNTRYAIQVDTSGAVTAGANANQQVTVREASTAYTFGRGEAKRKLTVTAGLFPNPFGYVLSASSSAIISPERPLAFSEGTAGIFNSQDYDKGIQLGSTTEHQFLFLPPGTKLTAALVNGTGRSGDATDAFKDQVYHIGYQTKNKIVSIGGSYYYGQVNVPSVLGAPAAGTGSAYTGRKKELYGVDAQVVTPFGPFVLAEYMGGLYEQCSYFAAPDANALTTVYAKDNHIDGCSVTGGWTFGQTGPHPLTLAAQYDVLRRGEGKPNTFNGGGNGSYTDENMGYGALYNLDHATRLRVWFERADRVAHAPGTSTPPRYGLFTGEVQVRY